MKKLNDNRVTEPSRIKEERKKALQNNYQRPELSGFDFNENERFEGDDLTVAYMCTSGC